MLGSLALIDEGETDHKIIAVRDSDPKYADVTSVAGTARSLAHSDAVKYSTFDDGDDFHHLHSRPLNLSPCRSLNSLTCATPTDLDKVKPHTVSKLIDWLKNYKTSDGKPGTVKSLRLVL